MIYFYLNKAQKLQLRHLLLQALNNSRSHYIRKFQVLCSRIVCDLHGAYVCMHRMTLGELGIYQIHFTRVGFSRCSKVLMSQVYSTEMSEITSTIFLRVPFFRIRHYANDSTLDFITIIGRYGCGRCLFPSRRGHVLHKRGNHRSFAWIASRPSNFSKRRLQLVTEIMRFNTSGLFSLGLRER